MRTAPTVFATVLLALAALAVGPLQGLAAQES
ncbi:MAG: hypothetical protein RL685_5457, partial [Pseudomonadota bacterium]